MPLNGHPDDSILHVYIRALPTGEPDLENSTFNCEYPDCKKYVWYVRSRRRESAQEDLRPPDVRKFEAGLQGALCAELDVSQQDCSVEEYARATAMHRLVVKYGLEDGEVESVAHQAKHLYLGLEEDALPPPGFRIESCTCKGFHHNKMCSHCYLILHLKGQ